MTPAGPVPFTPVVTNPYLGQLLRMYERTRRRLDALDVWFDVQERDEILHSPLLHDIAEDTDHTFDQLGARSATQRAPSAASRC